MHPVEMLLECIDMSGPQLPELVEPVFQFLKRPGIQAIDATLSVYGRFDKARFTKHAQMLRYCRLCHSQPALDLSD